MKLISVLPLALCALFTSASPVGERRQCIPSRTCVDFVNECGKFYGGCYNPCEFTGNPKDLFPAPPCPVAKRQQQCPSRTCVDFVNECGKFYGGCYDRCVFTGNPKDLFQAPACP